MVKCQICKEKMPKSEVYVLTYVNRNGVETTKKGHQQCCDDWYQDYISVKCDVCKEKIPKDEVFYQEYESNGLMKTKKGHKTCVEYWYQENYWSFLKMRSSLISTLQIDQLTKQMMQRLHTLHQRYEWDIITKAIKNKSEILLKHFRLKGWNYVFAIIENEAVRVYSVEKTRRKELDKTKQIQDNVIQITEYQKQESRDISQFLD